MRIAGPAVPFIDELPAYEIRDGNMHILVGGECLCCMSIRTFRLGMAEAGAVLDKYDRSMAEIVPFRREFPMAG